MNKPTFCIIGTTQLAIVCCKFLLANNWKILTIISSDTAVTQWAKQQNIDCSITMANLHDMEFDYLFSIVNEVILTSKVLRSPQKMAINYHDAPLPSYAGTHSTSWAILNNESAHGITWHVMAEKVDAGDIIKYVTIPIEHQETAASLNIKCYQAAQQSFAELISSLLYKNYQLTPQILNKRTFFGQYKKPYGNGLITWTDTAENIFRLYRACEFGMVSNTFSTCKMLIAGECLVIQQVMLVNAAENQFKPGQICNISDENIDVATTKNVIRITKLCFLNGRPITLRQLTSKYGLKIGTQLSSPEKKQQTYFKSLSSALGKYENFWLQQLHDSQNTRLPYFTNSVENSVSNYITKTLKSTEVLAENEVLACLLIYLYRMCQDTHITIQYSSDELLEYPQQFISGIVPINQKISAEDNYQSLLKQVSSMMLLLKNNKTHLLDCSLRYKQSQPHNDSFVDGSKIMLFSGANKNVKHLVQNNTQLIIHFDTENKSCDLILKDEIKSTCLLNTIHQHLTHILDAVRRNNKQSIKDIAILSSQEKNQLLNLRGNIKSSNDTALKSIPELFDIMVKEQPNQTAILHNNEALTYKILAQQTNELVLALRDLGIPQKSNIGILLPRSTHAIVAMLAILKHNSTYVPLSLDYPLERIKYILNDAGVKFIISNTKHKNKLKTLFDSVFMVDIDQLPPWSTYKKSLLNISHSQPHDPAYILYTSGSTGYPKGVLINQLGIINLIKTLPLKTSADNTILNISNLTFDISVYEIWSGLLNGSKIIIPPDDFILPQWIKENKEIQRNIVSIMTAGKFANIIQETPEAFDDFSLLFLGGEALPIAMVKILLARKASLGLKLRIFNVYGPTENTILSTCYEIKSITDEESSIPIGRPLTGTNAFVLDRNQQLLPINIPGELYLSGSGLSPGYINQPEHNRESFIPNPFSQCEDDKILYKTGDLVKWGICGNLEFIGRNDSQIKLAGSRIDLTEIQIQLESLTCIKSAIVISDEKNRYLIGFLQVNLDVASSSRRSKLIARVKNDLGNMLPRYMIPSFLYILNHIPLTKNGKIDRKKLLNSHHKNQKNNVKTLMPSSFIEQELILYYQNILEIARLDNKADFFQLGGNSLLATQLIIKIQKNFAVQLSLYQLFKYPKINKLANIISTSFVSDSNNQEIEPTKATTRPLSYYQEPLFSFEHLYKSTATYNIPILIKLTGNLQIGALNDAFVKLIERHSILRCRVKLNNNVPELVIKKQFEFSILFRSNNDFNQNVDSYVKHEASKPFDLFNENDLPIRVNLIELTNKQHYMLVVFHHFVADLNSLDIFYSEISKIYNAYSRGKQVRLAKLPYQYVDFCIWQRKSLTIALANKHHDFWQHFLINAPTSIILSADYGRTALQHHAGETYSFTIQKCKLYPLQEYVTKNNATMFMAMLTCFYMLIHYYTDENDIVIGVPVSTRHIEGTKKLIGLFINTLPLYLNIDATHSFSDLLLKAKEILLECYRHSSIPLQANTAVNSHVNIPDIKIAFNYQQAGQLQPVFSQLESECSILSTNTAKFEYSLDVVEKNDCYELISEFNTSIFKRQTIVNLTKNFRYLLRQISEKPDKKIKDFYILDKQQQHLIKHWNKTGKSWGTKKTLIELFEQQVRLTPDNIAITAENTQIKYNDLNQQANRLANFLLTESSTSNRYVVIYLPPSPDFIVAILGALKAGFAFIPIETVYPSERLRAIIADANPSFIITYEKSIEQISFYKKNIICLDKNNVDCKSGNNNPQIKINSMQPISVIYTSGSTGKPKGVVNLHKGALNHLLWMKSTYQTNSKDTVLQKTSCMFDAAFGEIMLPLVTGAQLIIANSDDRKDIFRIISLIKQYNITVIQFVPSQLNIFISAVHSDEIKTLKHVLCGGEILSANSISNFMTKCTAKLHNLYGLTEASDDTTHWCCERLSSDELVPIGKPISNTICLVLNKNLQLVPVGVPGQLYIGGISLAQGYLNLPKLTEKKFIKNPWHNIIASKTLFNTGDMVKWLPTGELTYIERVDQQIKYRGFRIDLREIESVLLKHPHILQSAAVISNPTLSHQRIIAFVVSAVNQHISTSDIKFFLNRYLPYYMQPTDVIIVKKLPYLSNGKIDRVSLANTLPRRDSHTTLSPMTETEEKLHVIWAELLQNPTISTVDNFFDLGGHSLMAAQLMIRIQNEYRVSLPLSVVLQNPTIKDLGKFLDNKQHQAPFSPLIKIDTKKNNNKQSHDKANAKLFFVHPLGGSIYCYQNLADELNLLDAQHNSYNEFYAFEDTRLHGFVHDKLDIVELATMYLHELRQLNPHGPYVFGGWSFGGVIAAEMVHQLQMTSNELARLILIDSSSDKNSIDQFDDWENTNTLLSYLGMLGIKVPHKKKIQESSLVGLIEQGSLQSNQKYTDDQISRILTLVKDNLQLLKSYQKPKISTNTLLIKTQDFSNQDINLWNEQIQGEITSVTIKQANHWSLLDAPNVKQIAEAIYRFINIK